MMAILCFFNTFADYYGSELRDQFENGDMMNGNLIGEIRYAANKNFRPLGYKKRAKKVLFGEIHLERDNDGYFVMDVYCGMKVRSKVGPNRIPTNNIINTEHTWPQSLGSRSEPKRGDLHHLFPTHMPANSARSSHPFGEVVGRDATDQCSASQKGKIINPKTGKTTTTFGFQPPFEHRGDTARAMFYFAAKYGYKLDQLQEFYLKKWDKEDPVDAKEMKRNDGIEKAQGNRNPFIDFPGLIDRIKDI
jgi:deoxyribonuclease-1